MSNNQPKLRVQCDVAPERLHDVLTFLQTMATDIVTIPVASDLLSLPPVSKGRASLDKIASDLKMKGLMRKAFAKKKKTVAKEKTPRKLGARGLTDRLINEFLAGTADTFHRSELINWMHRETGDPTIRGTNYLTRLLQRGYIERTAELGVWRRVHRAEFAHRPEPKSFADTGE